MAWEELVKEWGERYKISSSKDEKAAYWNCSAELLEELRQQGIRVNLQTATQCSACGMDLPCTNGCHDNHRSGIVRL